METKIKFRDELKAFVRKALETEIDKLSTVKQSKIMTRFYVDRVRRAFNPSLVPIDMDDLEACVIDGADDCGVDFIYRSDGAVLIIQSKFRGFGTSEKLDDIVSFGEVLRRLHPDTGKVTRKTKNSWKP
jgi:hypothetical protein